MYEYMIGTAAFKSTARTRVRTACVTMLLLLNSNLVLPELIVSGVRFIAPPPFPVRVHPTAVVVISLLCLRLIISLIDDHLDDQ